MPEQHMSEENQTPVTGEENSAASILSDSSKSYSADEVANLMKALKSEREARKTTERQVKEFEAQLSKFKEVNPDEYIRLQQEAAQSAEARAAADERVSLLEDKYGAQAAEASKIAAEAQSRLADLQKKYALEKVFNAAGGRTDAADGVSFFDMFAGQIGASFRLEPNGVLTVVDAGGDPILDKESGKRISPDDFIAAYKVHPIYGTFFKGAKGSGAGIGYGGTDANGMPTEDLNSLSVDELFKRAFT
jgi:hypothetical protein